MKEYIGYIKHQLDEVARIKRDIISNLDRAAMRTICCSIIDYLAETSGQPVEKVAHEITETVISGRSLALVEVIDRICEGED